MPDTPITQRDLLNVRDSLRELTATVAKLPERMEQTYVRKDVYQRDLDDIRTDLAREREWREWATKIVIGLVIAGLVALLIASRAGGVQP